MPMSAEGWVLVIGAVFAGVTGAMTLYFKYRQDRQREALEILTAHIGRLEAEIESGQKQLMQKQEAIDELAYLQTRCELREEASYGWMVRAKEHIDRLDAELVSMGRRVESSLELPVRTAGSDADRAAYLQRRSQYNTTLSAAVSNHIIASNPGSKGP